VDDFDTHIQGGDTNRGNGSPIFELIAKYTTRLVKPEGSQAAPVEGKESAPPSTSAGPSYSLRIYSSAIINALQSVVQYYPGQDLTGEDIVVRWLYPILVHHYEELSQFRDRCAAKDLAALCTREKNAYDHLGLLLRFLDKHVMADVEAEKERNRNGFETFEGQWVRLKPGTTMINNITRTKDLIPGVVHSISGGIFEYPPEAWTVNMWSMAYDGEEVGRVLTSINVDKYDGEREDDNRIINFHDTETIQKDEDVMKLVEHGEMYWRLLRKQCRYHKGKTREFPFNMVGITARTVLRAHVKILQVDGLVMVDLKTYYADFPSMKPRLMGGGDCRKWISDCTCIVCKEKKGTETKKLQSPFETYNGITLEQWDNIETHQYFLCPKEIDAFVFRTRSWGKDPCQYQFKLTDELIFISEKVHVAHWPRALRESTRMKNRSNERPGLQTS
jgi:hypothetical protein